MLFFESLWFCVGFVLLVFSLDFAINPAVNILRTHRVCRCKFELKVCQVKTMGCTIIKYGSTTEGYLRTDKHLRISKTFITNDEINYKGRMMLKQAKLINTANVNVLLALRHTQDEIFLKLSDLHGFPNFFNMPNLCAVITLKYLAHGQNYLEK